MLVIKQLTVARKKYDVSKWWPSTVWLPTLFKIYSFMFNSKTKRNK